MIDQTRTALNITSLSDNCFKRNCDSPRMGNFLKIVSKLGSFFNYDEPGSGSFRAAIIIALDKERR